MTYRGDRAARALLVLGHMHHLLYASVLAGLVGCTSGIADPEAEVSIVQGVYGVTISACDIGSCQDTPAAGVTVNARNGDTITPVTSNEGGFFELELQPATYELCVAFPGSSGACTTVVVPRGRVRADWEAGPGGGVWCLADGNCGAR